MIIQPLDLKILKEFCSLKENEYTTTWELMKKIFKSSTNSESNRNNDNIKKRIEKMSKYGFFKVEGTPKKYILNSDNVDYDFISFPGKRCKAITLLIEKKFVSFEL